MRPISIATGQIAMFAPSNSAQSPPANTLLSLVCILSLTITARFVRMPASSASSLLARTPVDMITISAGIVVPSASITPSTLPSPTISAIFAPTTMFTPFFAAIFFSISAPTASILPSSSSGAPSSTVTSSFSLRSSHALSRPSTPPPITTACFACSAIWLIFSTSAMVRTGVTPSRSAPLMGGMKL